MAVHHSMVGANSSYRIIDQFAFVIEPEYLEAAEIIHELLIRNQPTIGSRRELTKQLRDLVHEEAKTENTPVFSRQGTPTTELNYVQVNFNRLQILLENVCREVATQAKFMSLYIHLGGRTHRAALATDQNESARAVEYTEKLTGMYQIFLQYRKRAPPPARRPLSTPNQPLTVAGVEHGIGIPNVIVNDQNNGQNTVNENIPTDTANNFNATLLPNGNARLSGQFHRTSGARLTPIHNPELSDPLDEFFNNYTDTQARIEDCSEDGSLDENDRHDILNQSRVENDALNLRVGQNGIENRNGQNPTENGATYGIQNANNNNAAPQAVIEHRNEQRGPTDPHLINPIPLIPRGQVPILNPMNNANANTNRQASTNDANTERLDNLERLVTNMSQLIERLVVNPNAIGVQNTQHPPIASNFVNSSLRHNRSTHNVNIRQPIQGFTPVNANRSRSSTLPNTSTTARSNNLPVHKWPFKFTGDKFDKNPVAKDLTAFFKRVDLFSRAEFVSHDEIFRRIHLLLGGKALAWYTQYGAQYRNWEELQNGLRRHFETSLSRYMKMQKLNSRRQFSNESCMDYIAEMNQLFEEVGLDEESERVAIVQNGLREEYRQIAHAQRWLTVEQLDHQLRTLEFSDDLRRKVRTNQWQRKDAFTADANENDQSMSNENDMNANQNCETMNIETSTECMAVGGFGPRQGSNRAFEPQNAKKSSEKADRSKHWTCFNCKQVGHGYRDCDSDIIRTFCYRCGKDNVKCRDCDCRPKNL